MKFKAALLILMLLIFVPGPVKAQVPAPAQPAQEAQFLTSLPDIPLMPGLTELTDQTVAFDKPSGRIIEAALQIHGPARDEIRLYYESVLPQFGWSRIGDNAFIRGDERLQISFEDYEDEHFLRIMVSPQ